MAVPGWYPDPDGTPHRYRYFDGTAWSAETTTDPRVPAPGQQRQVGSGVPAPRKQRDTRGRGLLVLLGVAVLVVAVVAASVLLGRNGSGSQAGTDRPTSTVSGWDDSSPLPTADPSAATRRPTPSQAQPPGSQACPAGSPGQHQTWPKDGRVHGGGLSFPVVAQYPAPRTDYQFSWMNDVMSQVQTTEPGWISIFAVGSVASDEEGFATPQQAAESSMQCAITEGWYAEFTGRKNLKDTRISIDGHPGWLITAEIRVDRPDLSVGGDQLTFAAVDTGQSGQLSLWCGMVPLGDADRLAIASDVLSRLAVD